MFTLPNILGFFRLLAAPIVFYLIFNGKTELGFWLFAIAALTDAIDGPIARKMNLTNTFGLFLDPIADKLLVNAAFVSAALQGLLPVWLAGLVFARDILLGGCFALSKFKDWPVTVDPVRLSKTNTGLQILLVALALGGAAFQIKLYWPIKILILVVALTTILSGLIYLGRWLKTLPGKSGP
ncbi:MAG: CDP-alcohol phosphatidyltransferase family protein [Sphingomonadales bacterium]